VLGRGRDFFVRNVIGDAVGQLAGLGEEGILRMLEQLDRS